LVTQLLADVLDKFRTTILFLAKKVSSSPTDLAANAPLILDLLTSPDVSRSLTAKVSESSATLFEAQIVIPDIPAKGQRPAVAARNISVSLEADSPEPSFTLFIDWGSGRSRISGIKARRATDGKVIVTVPIDELKIELGLTREASGAVVAEIDHEWVRKSLSGQSLKLLSMQPMTAVPDTPKAVAERANIEKAAQASKSFTPSGHALSFGGGLQYAGVPSALYSVGWRFTYAVAGDLVGLPLQVQLDYAPKAGLVSGNVGFGVSVTPISIRDVPVTFWLVPGVRAGAVGVGESGTGASPVFGPSVGIGAGFGISPRLQVQLSGEYFHNVLSTAADKGISSVPSVSLGSILRF